jgi:alpha-ketoglutarate-dependent 2,4-dichlorophenoxyacetate dioxygenase
LTIAAQRLRGSKCAGITQSAIGHPSAQEPIVTATFTPLHPTFAAEVAPIDLRQAHDPAVLESLQRGMAQYGVLVFRDQRFTNEEQMAFAQRFDGELHARTSTAVLVKNRHGNEALSDVSNVGADGQILPGEDRRRIGALANRLWHTDASFVTPPGRFSMLSARVVPEVRADTEFCDTRAAYAALDEATRATLEPLRVHHSIAYSREVLGFVFSAEEREKLKGAEQPLIRRIARDPRPALYLASHAQAVVGMPLAEGRLLLRELIEHATQPQFVYRHQWQAHDFVIWDNRTTMHRATPFDDRKYRREMVRTTTLDIEQALP